MKKRATDPASMHSRHHQAGAKPQRRSATDLERTPQARQGRRSYPSAVAAAIASDASAVVHATALRKGAELSRDGVPHPLAGGRDGAKAQVPSGKRVEGAKKGVAEPGKLRDRIATVGTDGVEVGHPSGNKDRHQHHNRHRHRRHHHSHRDHRCHKCHRKPRDECCNGKLPRCCGRPRPRPHPRPVRFGLTAFVDAVHGKDGNDGGGELENPARPFLTIQGAVDAISERPPDPHWTIEVSPGVYEGATIGVPLTVIGKGSLATRIISPVIVEPKVVYPDGSGGGGDGSGRSESGSGSGNREDAQDAPHPFFAPAIEVALIGLSIRYDEPLINGTPGLLVDGGDVVIERCDIALRRTPTLEGSPPVVHLANGSLRALSCTVCGAVCSTSGESDRMDASTLVTEYGTNLEVRDSTVSLEVTGPEGARFGNISCVSLGGSGCIRDTDTGTSVTGPAAAVTSLDVRTPTVPEGGEGTDSPAQELLPLVVDAQCCSFVTDAPIPSETIAQFDGALSHVSLPSQGVVFSGTHITGRFPKLPPGTGDPTPTGVSFVRIKDLVASRAEATRTGGGGGRGKANAGAGKNGGGGKVADGGATSADLALITTTATMISAASLDAGVPFVNALVPGANFMGFDSTGSAIFTGNLIPV